MRPADFTSSLPTLVRTACALLLALFAAAPGRAGQAAPTVIADGELDPGFFGGGTFHYDTGFSPGDFDVRAAGVLPGNGDLWWAGDLDQSGNHYFFFAVGNPVNGIGPNCFLAPPDGSTVRLRAAALDPDGGLVLAGDEYLGGVKTIVLARIADPELGCAGQDLAFDESAGDGDGWAEYSFAGNGTVAAVAADRWTGFEGLTGLTVVGSWNSGGGNGSDLLVMRLNLAGHLDTTFASGGTLAIDWAGQEDFGRAVAIQDNAPDPPRLWVGGTVHDAAPRTDADFFVARISHTGTIEGSTAFGFGPSQLDDDTLRSLSFDPARRQAYAVGYSVGSSETRVAIARLSESVALDPGFSGDGLATFGYASGTGSVSLAYAAAVQGDGKLVVAGSHRDSAVSDQDFAALRVTPAGLLDDSFNSPSGAILVPFDLGGSNEDLATSLSLADGRPLLGGSVTLSDGSLKPAMVRLWNPLVFADGFEGDTITAWSSWH
jgi:uncharacterized delta-60 repeat protein